MDDSRYGRLMCSRHYRSSYHLPHLSDLSRTFGHHIVHHLFQFRHFLTHIEQDGIKYLAFALESFALTCSEQCRKALGILYRKIGPQNSSRNLTVRFYNRNLLCDILQLTNVSRPRISYQFLLGIFSQLDSRHPVLLGKVGGKLTEQQPHIVSPLTQRRYLNRHRIQAII